MSAPGSSHRSWSRGLIACLLAAGCLLTACGGSGTNADPDRDGIKAAVVALQRAVAAGDGDRTCQALSDAARKHVRGMGHDAPGRPSPPCYLDVYLFIDGLRQSPGWRERTRRPVTDIVVDGSTATAKIDLGRGRAANVPFVKEEGQWRVDALYGGMPAARQKDHY